MRCSPSAATARASTRVEDLDLCLRLAERGRLANLPETLLHYRHHLRKTSNARAGEHRRLANEVLRDARLRRGLDVSSGDELPALASRDAAPSTTGASGCARR